MHDLWIILEKIFYLFLLTAAGGLAKRFNLLSDQGEKDLGRLLVDFFWPALIFVSITTTLQPSDIGENILLPLFALVTALTGLVIGFVVIKIGRFGGDRKKVFYYHASVNNFVFMVLPFVNYLIPGKGAGLLFVHNLGYLVFIWTVGVVLLAGTADPKAMIVNLLSPGMIATAAGIILVMTNLHRYIPSFVGDTFATLGNATLSAAMITAGARIYKLGKKALVFDAWNISLGLLRLLAVPGLLLALSLLLSKWTRIAPETLTVFMIVNLMPVSINSVSMAARFRSSPELAAQGIVFTHLFSVLTVPFFMYFIRTLFTG